MNKFTIKVDLSTFFEDERKFVIVLVDPLWNKVELLQRHVENIFKLNVKIQFVTEEGYFIPPEEEIEVIKYINKIRAFTSSEFCNGTKKHKKIKADKKLKQENEITNEIEMPVQDTEILPQNKRKYHSLAKTIEDFTTSTPKSPHAKRCKSIITTANDSNEKVLEEEVKKNKKPHKKKKHKLVGKQLSKEIPLIAPTTNVEIVNVEEVHKQKESTFKNNISIQENIIQQENDEKLLNDSNGMNLVEERKKYKKKLLKHTLNNEITNQSTSKMNNNHIHFDEIDNATVIVDQPTNYNETAKNLNNSIRKKSYIRPKFNCELFNASSQEIRMFKMKGCPKETIKILENVILSPSKQIDIFQVLNNSNKNDTTATLAATDLYINNENNLTNEATQITLSKPLNATTETSYINKEKTSETLKFCKSKIKAISQSPQGVTAEIVKSSSEKTIEHSLPNIKISKNSLPNKKNLDEKNNKLYLPDIDIDLKNNSIIEFETDPSAETNKCNINKTILDASMNTIDSSDIIDLSESNDNIF